MIPSILDWDPSQLSHNEMSWIDRTIIWQQVLPLLPHHSAVHHQPDPMVAKLHAEHAITAQNSESPDMLLTTLAKSSEMPQHVQEE